jgi:P27 family predicted phage terminase small subunit
MGVRGPAPQPTAIRKRNGNPSRRPMNPNEPRPPAGEPRMPRSLSRRARQEWRTLSEQLIEMGVLSQVDGIALGLLCTDIAELERIQADLSRTGYLVRNPASRNIRTNPLMLVAADLHRRVMQGLREFGLTPAARSRVETVPGFGNRGSPVEAQMYEFLQARKQVKGA